VKRLYNVTETSQGWDFPILHFQFSNPQSFPFLLKNGLLKHAGEFFIAISLILYLHGVNFEIIYFNAQTCGNTFTWETNNFIICYR